MIRDIKLVMNTYDINTGKKNDINANFPLES